MLLGCSPLAVAASRPVVAAAGGLGPELLTNGSFATDSDWALTNGDLPMTISGGKLRGPGGGTDSSYAEQAISQPAGTYRFVFTIDTVTEGSFFANFDVAEGTARSAAGTYSEDIVVPSAFTSFQIKSSNGSDAVMDDASLKAVT